MRRSVKWGLGIAGILLVLIAAPIALLLLLTPNMIGCDYVRRDLGTSKLGDRVTAEEEFCSGFGASDFMTISLAEAHGGNHGTVFSYEPYLGTAYPMDPPPRVTWIADTIVIIHIDRVNTVHVRHPALGRNRVRYDIGAASSR